jgi:uncharacterized protein
MHGVSTAEIERLFRSELATFPDPQHSQQEERFVAIGKTEANRWIFVVFTLRMRKRRSLIRPISARYMHSKEVEHYEKEIAAVAKR